MWSPPSAAQLLEAIGNGTLPHEAAAFDVKAQPPAPKASRDIAIDVAAMATDGGVILYGVLEDKEAVTFAARPFALAGVKDRISDVVSAAVRERIEFDIRLLPLDDDPAIGFVVVEVPASSRAPHMVEVKGEFRYYGRVPGGNVVLTEAQIARLYDRRRVVESEVERAVDAAIAQAPLPAASDVRGDLHLVARPLLSDQDLRSRAWTGDDGPELGAAIVGAFNAIRFKTPWDPNIADILSGGQNLPTLYGFALFNPPIVHDGERNDRYVSRLEVLDDGTSRYFHAAVAEQREGSPHYEVRDTAVAQITAHFVVIVGRLLDSGSYHGPVDLFIALTGAAGAVSAELFAGNRLLNLGSLPQVPTNDYRGHVRVQAARLLSEPCDVATSLFGRLLRTIRPSGFPDPLQR